MSDPFCGIKLKFPVKTDLRVVVDSSLAEAEIKQSITLICLDHKIPLTWGSAKASKAGNFYSYTIHLLFVTKEKMDLLYRDLALLPGIKTVL